MIKWITVLIFLVSSEALAEKTSEDFCFISHSNHSAPVRLALRTYFDNDIEEVVGAVVRYGTSKKIISLVFAENIVKGDGFEDHWLEVYNKNITGEYVYERSGVGGGISAYSLIYKNFQTSKSRIFSLSTDSGDCGSFKFDTKIK